MKVLWKILLLSWASVCFAVSPSQSEKRQSLIPRSFIPSSTTSSRTTLSLLRGGGENFFNSPIYELNPNYVAPPAGSTSSSTTSTTITRTRNWPPQDDHGVWIETQMYDNNDNNNAFGGPQQQQPTLGSIPTSFSRTTSISSSANSIYQQIKYFVLRLQHTSPTLFATLVACVVVHVLWYIPSAQPMLEHYFVCKRINLQPIQRSVSILFSSISHKSLFHLAINLYGFLNLGPFIQRNLVQQRNQPWPLWPLVVGSACMGGLFHLMLSRGSMAAGCLGLSDVTLSLAAMYARLFPNQKLGIVLFGIIPVSMEAYKLLRIMFAWSIFGSLLSMSGRVPSANVAHLAHLGGIVYGCLFYEAWIRRNQLFKR